MMLYGAGNSSTAGTVGFARPRQPTDRERGPLAAPGADSPDRPRRPPPAPGPASLSRAFVLRDGLLYRRSPRNDRLCIPADGTSRTLCRRSSAECPHKHSQRAIQLQQGGRPPSALVFGGGGFPESPAARSGHHFLAEFWHQQMADPPPLS